MEKESLLTGAGEFLKFSIYVLEAGTLEIFREGDNFLKACGIEGNWQRRDGQISHGHLEKNGHSCSYFLQ